ASVTLRRTVAARYPLLFGSSVPGISSTDLAPHRAIPGDKPNAIVPLPPCRRLRAYAIDPSFSTQLATSALNEGLLRIVWEPLQRGPIGEYIEVTDVDEDGTVYDPVDLNDPRLVAQDGFPPSEGNPQFHQQMVYGTSMTTIAHFERAMGRHVLWRPGP